MILTLLTVLYFTCAVLLSLYAIGAVILLVAYWRHRHECIPTPPVKRWPRVAVQLPIYNERYVVERLLEAVASLDYPRDCLTVQVLDDSTDETTAILADCVKKWQDAGLNIQHIRRGSRAGYKAGALAYGIGLLDAEYVAVLDADFVPPPDFLRQTVPHMVNDPTLGVVQGRWGHLNAYSNILTMGQALALDGHFVVEQAGRNRSGWLMNFNGSGGVWRVKAIEDAGGWKDTTLTEDLDLSYRAQLKGWRFLYLPGVEVPGELPPHLAAYKQQQSRWAKGGTQCLAMLIGPIWRSPQLTVTQRIMATLHLCQYLTSPLVLCMLILTPIMVLSHSMERVPIGPLGFAGLGPPLIFLASQYALYSDWRRRILALPALMALGTGLAWNNTKAVVGGLLKKKGEFKRTPKYASGETSTNKYVLRSDTASLIEAALSVYALWGALTAMNSYPTLVPYLTIYSIAFGSVAIWGLRESLLLRRLQPAPQRSTVP
jgi:cellulose synthase/poly-beta-1,6-N-acetylglucosamine synthase-like glycosyltransferase